MPSTTFNVPLDAQSIFEIVYPVGSIYMSVSSTSPATLFGGTWTQIQDTFLVSAGSTYTAGGTGGSATHTLTTTELPSHNHTFTGSEVTSGNQSAGHTHTYKDYYATTTGNRALTAAQGGSHSHNVTKEGRIGAGSSTGGFGMHEYTTASGWTQNATSSSGSGNNHNHSGENTNTTRTSDGVSADHTHKVTASGSIGNTGGGTAFSTLPPYLAVYMWQRTA